MIFCGSGTTGAIDKLVRLLGLAGPRAERPVVFIGPYPIDEAWSAAMHAQARLGCLGATLAHQLEEARRIIRTAETAPALDPAVSAEFDRIRWFPLPSEARASVTP